MKQRDNSIDIIAGILILYMILGHCMQSAGMGEYTFNRPMIFLGFFMPWFFFKSGMYFTADTHSGKIMQLSKSLLVPFCKWTAIGFLAFLPRYLYNHDSDTLLVYLRNSIVNLIQIGSLPGNLPLWFLLTLFIVRVIANYICIKKTVVFIIMLVGLIIAYCCFVLKIEYPYYLANSSLGLFFYLLGYILKEYQYKKFVYILSSLLYAAGVFYIASFVDMRSNTLISGYYLFWVIWSVGGIIFIDNSIKYLSRYSCVWISLLKQIGLCSMNLYVKHWVLIILLYFVFKQLLQFTSTTYLSVLLIGQLILIFYELKTNKV